jgi:hypothetical protein
MPSADDAPCGDTGCDGGVDDPPETASVGCAGNAEVPDETAVTDGNVTVCVAVLTGAGGGATDVTVVAMGVVDASSDALCEGGGGGSGAALCGGAEAVAGSDDATPPPDTVDGDSTAEGAPPAFAGADTDGAGAGGAVDGGVDEEAAAAAAAAPSGVTPRFMLASSASEVRKGCSSRSATLGRLLGSPLVH